jgi:hypothetical protein
LRQRPYKRRLLPLPRVLLALVVLLVQTDAQGCYQSHVYTWRDLHTVSLLAEEYVFAAKDFAVDAGYYKAWWV